MKKWACIFALIFYTFSANIIFANLLNIDNEYDKTINYVSNNDIHERKFVDSDGKEILNVNGIYSKLDKIYDISTNELKYLLKADRHIFHESFTFGHTHYKHVNDALYSITGEKINNILKVDTTYNVTDYVNNNMKYIGVWNDYIIYSIFGYGPDDLLDLLKQTVEYDKLDDESDEQYFSHMLLVLYDIKNNKNITVSHYENGAYDLLPLNDKLFVYTVCSPYQNLLKVKMVDKNAQILKTAYYDIEDGNDKINDSIKLKIAYRMLMDDFVSNNELVKYDIDDIVNADIKKVKSQNDPLVNDKKYLINMLENCDNSSNKSKKEYKYYELIGTDYDAKYRFGKEIKGNYYRIVDDKMFVFDYEVNSNGKDEPDLFDYTFNIYDDKGKTLAKNIKLCNKDTIIHYGIDWAEDSRPSYMHSTAKNMTEKGYVSYLIEHIVDIYYYKLNKNGKYSLVSIDGKVLFDDIDDFALDEYQYGIRRYIVKKDGHWLFLDENGNILAKNFDINYDFNKIVKLGDDTFVLFYKDYHYDFDNSYFDIFTIDIYGKDGLVKKNLKQCDVANDKYFNVVTPLNYGLIDKTGKWLCKFSSFDNLVYD